MAHPQNNFSSKFQSDDTPATAALTLIVNGNHHVYTPTGNDKTINIPGIFRIYETETGTEIVSDIQTALGADSVPALVVETPNYNEDQYMYEGTIDTGWVFRHIGDKAIDTITVNTNGALIRATYNLDGVRYVTTSTSYSDVKSIFDAGNLPVLQESNNQYYPTHKDPVTIGEQTADSYLFMAFPKDIYYVDSDGEIRFSIYQCHPTNGWTLLRNDAVYNKTNVDHQLAKKQEQRGWLDFTKSYNDSSPDAVPHYVKICEIDTSFALANYGYRMAATEFDIAMTNDGGNGDAGTSAHFALSMTIGSGNIYNFFGNWTSCKSSEEYSSFIDRIDVILSSDKSKAEVYLVLKYFNWVTSGHIGGTVNAGFQNLTYRVDGLGTCWTYRNARVAVSTTAPDTTGATVTSFNYSLDTSTYCCNVTALGPDAPSEMYTEFDRSWAAGKPIFVYDDNPPSPYPTAKYIITAHSGTKHFYGMTYANTTNLYGIELEYDNGTWTITRSSNIIDSGISDVLVFVDVADIEGLSAGLRAQFNQWLLSSCTAHCEVILVKTTSGITKRWRLGNYLHSGNLSEYQFASVYRDNGSNTMDSCVVEYDASTNIFAISFDISTF